ncbi:MAG: 4-hydroxythreonine-4-phosphate dehydrogenase PdxA [Bacteriovoracaceae bacterium]
MKVYVTQGHEQGIGLEVFFKTSLLLTSSELSKIKLLAYPQSVKKTLTSLKLPYQIGDYEINLAGTSIQTEWLDKVNFSQSFTALDLGMKLAESGGVLYTLPTSKDQFPGFAGHTEYFRHFYKSPELGMFFSSPALKVLLLSDHVAIRDLTHVLTEEAIYKKLNLAFKSLNHWNWPINRVLISGINPHAGENGMIGSEDKRVETSIRRLKSKFKFEMSGPYSGDTLLFEQKSPHDVLVYLFHDQGLGVFKSLQGFIGSNITLGLPYPRFSPDHGTSFKLYGKNQADYRGCSYSLKEAITLLMRISDGKNSSNKSKSS